MSPDAEKQLMVEYTARCKLCFGTGGYVTLEGEDMERVWNPCSGCKGTGIDKNHPLLWVGDAI